MFTPFILDTNDFYGLGIYYLFKNIEKHLTKLQAILISSFTRGQYEGKIPLVISISKFPTDVKFTRYFSGAIIPRMLQWRLWCLPGLLYLECYNEGYVVYRGYYT